MSSLYFELIKDYRNKSSIIVTALCPKGAMLFRIVDRREERDALFNVDILIEATELVEAQNVVQFIMNNAKVFRVAGLIVKGKYDHILDPLYIL
jgi:hypothetical protein